jgi:hypothetical protein
MKGVKMMDISKYVSAEQFAELKALSKALADIRKIKIPGFQPDVPSFTVDPAHIHRVWSRP